MELFAKIVYGWKPLTIFAESFILDVWQGFETPVVFLDIFFFFLIFFSDKHHSIDTGSYW